MRQTHNQKSGCAACRKTPSQESGVGRSFHIKLWNNQNWDIEKINKKHHHTQCFDWVLPIIFQDNSTTRLPHRFAQPNLSLNFTFLTKRHSAVEMLQTRNQRSGCAACRKMPSQEPDAGKSFYIQLWNNQNWDIEKKTRSIIARNVLIEFY